MAYSAKSLEKNRMKQLLSDLRANGERAKDFPSVMPFTDDYNNFPPKLPQFTTIAIKTCAVDFHELANPQNILLILDAMDKMRGALETYSECDGYCGKDECVCSTELARQTIKEVYGE